MSFAPSEFSQYTAGDVGAVNPDTILAVGQTTAALTQAGLAVGGAIGQARSAKKKRKRRAKRRKAAARAAAERAAEEARYADSESDSGGSGVKPWVLGVGLLALVGTGVLVWKATQKPAPKNKRGG